jgi:hypothetical protein
MTSKDETEFETIIRYKDNLIDQACAEGKRLKAENERLTIGMEILNAALGDSSDTEVKLRTRVQELEATVGRYRELLVEVGRKFKEVYPKSHANYGVFARIEEALEPSEKVGGYTTCNHVVKEPGCMLCALHPPPKEEP